MGRGLALLAAALLAFQSAGAQSLGDLLKLLDGLSSGSAEQNARTEERPAVTAKSLTGKWTYAEPAARYDGDNLVGTLGVSALESILPALYSKAGLTAGKGSVTFSAPDVFSARIGSYNVTGNYRMVSPDGTVVLSATVRNVSGMLHGSVVIDGDTLTLVLDAAAAAALVERVAPKASSNDYFKILKSVFDSYPGVKFGCKLTR